MKSQRGKRQYKRALSKTCLSKCFLILIFHFDLLIIQSWSQTSIPTTPAWGDKYPCWLLAAFGNLFMASFYCTPKEIGSLCILGKKNTLFKPSLLLRPPEHAMRAPQCLGTERLSVELTSSSPAADLLSVWGIPAPGPNPQTSLWRPQHTHAFFCLDNDLPWRLTQNRERRKGEGEREKDFTYIPDCKSCLLWRKIFF